MATIFIFDEEYEEVKFLGYTVTMPHAERIRYYIDKMKAVIKGYNVLEKSLQEQAEKCKAEGSGAWAWIQSHFWMGFECEENGGIVEVLLNIIDMNAGDIAPDYSFSDEFGKNTNAYKELVRLRRTLVREARDIENVYEGNYQSGKRAAFTKAGSNIRGMGFGIITNSALDLLAYNARSNATLRRQARKADKQYENDLKSLHKSTFGPYENQLLSLMFDQYIPAARNCIAMWANEVTEKLIAYEVRYNNNAVFSEISKFNPEQSQSIVDKVDIRATDDIIRKELLEAFKKCPYNESIYLKAAQAGLLDRDTFEYGAANYGYEKTIINTTKKYCSNNLADIDFVKKRISFMIIKYVNTEEKILEEIYQPIVSSIIRRYDVVKDLINTEKSIKPFIVNDLKICDIIDFINMDDSSLEVLIESYISKIITQKCWETLIRNNLIEWKKISQNNTYKYNEMNSYYIHNLLSKITEYKKVMSEAYKKYMNSEKEYKEKCNNMQSTIEQLEKDISQLGLFGFKKKKVLREELERQKSMLYDFSSHNKPSLNWI